MGTSVLHIKTEVECKVFLFDEEKGTAPTDKYFNLEVRKGEQKLVFVSTSDNNLRCEKKILIEDFESDYKLQLNSDDFVDSPFLLANKGDRMDLFKLGCSYYWGDGVQQNRQLAVNYWLEAYNGLSEIIPRFVCAWNLGMCYRYGIGVEKNVYHETKWFRTSYEVLERPNDNYNMWGYDKQWEWDIIKTLFQGTSVGDICIARFRPLINSEMIDAEGLSKATIRPPKYLFFDTETTGLPDDENEPASNIDNWPRLVQLAWILTDENGECLSSNSEIIQPEGFSIPIEAVGVHGITTEKALNKGEPLKKVIDSFLRDVRVAKYLVGHNVSFDQNVVGAELHRLGIKDEVSTAHSICTMKETVDLCAIKKYWDDDDIPELYGEEIDDEYDYPSLRDLYWELFEDEFDDAHDAMADTTACMKCFFELKKRGEIADPFSLEEAMAETANDD